MRKKTVQIGVRIAASDVVLLRRICESRGEDLSDFVRQAIRTEMARLSFPSPLDEKALGLAQETDAKQEVDRTERGCAR